MNGRKERASVARALWTRFGAAAISLRNMVIREAVGGTIELLTNYEPVAV
jgi:hypothetical protein